MGYNAVNYLQVESAWSDEEDGGDSVASVHEQVACCKSETCQHASTEHEEGSSHKRQKLAATPDVSKVANEDSTSLNADCSATVQDVNKDEAGLVTQKESNESSVPIQSAGYAALLGANSPGKDGAVVNEVDAAYIMAFLDRHICPQETPAAGTQDVNVCGGTMAPHEADMDLYTCNMCGITRSETTRIAELEQAYLAVQTGTD